MLKRVCDDVKTMLVENPEQRIVVTQGLHHRMRDFIRSELEPETVQFVGMTMSLDKLCERLEFKARRYYALNYDVTKQGPQSVEEAFETRTGQTFTQEAFKEDFMKQMNVDKLYLQMALDSEEIGASGVNIDVEVEENAMPLLRQALDLPQLGTEVSAGDVAEQNWLKMKVNLQKKAKLASI